MLGVRAFGENEGGLGHAGDFRRLFTPLLPELSELAVFLPTRCETFRTPFFDELDDLDEIDRRNAAFFQRIEDLSVAPPNEPPYYCRPGVFPDCADCINDNWNTLIFFQTPFPDYAVVSRAYFGQGPADNVTRNDRTPAEKRRSLLATRFQFCFRNIDAFWWEVFSPRNSSLQNLVEYLRGERVDFDMLEFERDYPENNTSINRTFRDVNEIWRPDDDATKKPM